MSQETWQWSFAKFLEVCFHCPGMTNGDIQCFGHGDLVTQVQSLAAPSSTH